MEKASQSNEKIDSKQEEIFRDFLMDAETPFLLLRVSMNNNKSEQEILNVVTVILPVR